MSKFLVLLLPVFWLIGMHDVLPSVISDKKIQNKNDVYTLFKEGKNIEATDLQKALEIYDEVIQNARRYNLPKLELEALSNKVEALEKLEKYDSAISEIKKTVALAKKVNNEKILGEIYLTAAHIYYHLSKYDSSNHFIDLAENIFKKSNDPRGDAKIKINRAYILHDKADYIGALKLNIEAVKVLEKGVDSNGLALIYDNIGMENLELKFYPEAVKYLNKAISISERLKDTLQLLVDYSNLGVTYRRQDSLYKAEVYYLRAFEIAVKNNMEETIARLSMNLGIIYSKQKNYEKALEYYRTSLEKCEKLTIKYGITLNLINMGVAYYETGQFLKAEESDKRALEYIKQLKLPKEEQVLYSGFYLMYKKWGKPEKALYYLEKYKDLSDSLLNETKQKQFMEIQTKYETEKKEHQIVLLQKESVEKDFESLIIISLSTTLIFIMSFLVYRNRKLRKIEQQKAENLKIKLDSKNSELACKAISIAQQQTKIKNYWNDISQKLQENNLQIHGFWEKYVKSMEESLSDEKEWEDFTLSFEQVHPVFANKIKELCPEFNSIELRTCYLLRLNLSSKEMGDYLGLSPRTIDNIRYRIRKKLNLEKDINLSAFITSL